MKVTKRIGLLVACLLLGSFIKLKSSEVITHSIYPERPNDQEAVYFTTANFNITTDGKTDVSGELQKAINQLKTQKNFGIIFIPEGTYKITRTIYIPKAIRLIGYGEKRPMFVLAESSPGYQEPVLADKGKANYMFWFTSGTVNEGEEPRDASPGTFYSALSNIDLKIENGNPYAVALRTHFAQHSFISYSVIEIGNGKAGLFDVGNEMENVAFYGGDYGIYTTKTSPSWQMMMVDTYFEGQRKAAIKTQEAGLTIVRLTAKKVPTVVEIEKNRSEKLFMEDCLFDEISGPAIIVSNEYNQTNQVSLLNIVCRKVPILVNYRRSKTETQGDGQIYKVKKYTHGLHIDNGRAEPEMKTDVDLQPLTKLPPPFQSDIPRMPAMETWVNIADLGAKGDDFTDNTSIFQEAIEKYPTIYVPQGWYVVSEPLKLKTNTCIIGLHPIATQIKLLESTPAFSGFGAPQPVIETPKNGKNIMNGIGINTGAYNYRAVGCKWMAGADSYMNDVKFVGGHGSMDRGPEQPRQRREQKISTPEEPVANQGADKAWDNQYWSLWVTNGGGGVFKDVWTANTYSTNGIYVNNTTTEGRIYAMSVEHHMLNEARFKNVSNWRMYAFQFEEEVREGMFSQPIELQECENLLFANLYLFRVIWVNTPHPYAIRTWNCRNLEFLNVHNFAQMRYYFDVPLYDINKAFEVRPWEFTQLKITGDEEPVKPLSNKEGEVEKLATGFEFAEGIARDSKGNIFFSEQRLRRIYKWDVQKKALTLIADFPWEPLSLAFDTEDHLLVIFKYNPQPGYKINGEQEVVPTLPDASGTTFSAWGNSGFATWVYSVDPENPEETIKLLPRVKTDLVTEVAKAIYPAHRWRDTHDFDEISVATPAYSFIAPDKKTIIPEFYDLARSSSVLEAFPGQPFYAADEFEKRMVKMDVDKHGQLSNLTYFANEAEFGSAVDKKGNVYIANGQIYIYNKNGEWTGRIEVPERPSAIQFGGKNRNTLFITARSSLYRVNLDRE